MSVRPFVRFYAPRLGLIILEASANVVLPDNGLPWRKLRENDLSDVELGHLSDELINVIVHLVECDPSIRTTIDALQAHPVIAKVQALRRIGLELENEDHSERHALDEGNNNNRMTIPKAKGAVIAEEDHFLANIFEEVRHAWHSPRRNRVSHPENSIMEVD